MKVLKEIITFGGIELRFLLDGDDTDNRMVMFEMTFKAGAKVPVPHYHVEVDEALYVLRGTMSSIVDGNPITIGTGEHLFVPRGVTHYHDNLSDTDMTALCVLTPASIGPAYFRELKAIITPGVPPDPAKATEIMLRHGLVPIKQ